MKNKPGFCYDIFKNLAFWNFSDGSVGYMPCSVYRGFFDKEISPDQSWNGENRRKIIALVEQGKTLPGCQTCYDEESAGRTSRRQSDADHFKNFLQSPDIDANSSGPESLDYSVGNLCNLKCIICNPNNSSAWIPDYKKLYPDRDLTQFLYRKNRITEISDTRFLRNIKSLHFHGGGEPLMSPAHVNLLRNVQETKGLHDVRVYYNTNGTQRVDQEVLDLWSECQLVEIYFSIDDVGERFDYQRTGAKWHELLDNIDWYKERMPHNHLFNVNCVWSYLNLFYLDELVLWHQQNFSSNRYGDPCNLIFQKASGPFGIQHFSSQIMQLLKNKFAGFPPLLNLLNDIRISDRDHSKFWEHITAIDCVRSADFKKTCSEWSHYLSGQA